MSPLAVAMRASLVVCLVLAITACGGSGGDDGTSPTDSGNPPIVGGGNGSLLSQTITFAQAGPIDLTVGSYAMNIAAGPGLGLITYGSSNSGVVLVDSVGHVTAIGPGTAVITATKAADAQFAQLTATYSINVTLAPQVLILGGTSPFTVMPGQSLSISATGPGVGLNTYDSSDSSVATVVARNKKGTEGLFLDQICADQI